MKTNTVQTLILALVGLVIMFFGLLFILAGLGENSPELDARLSDLFGIFAGIAEILERVILWAVGGAIVWVGYKIYPFHDDEQETETNSDKCLTVKPIE
jgi:type II secretory pathway component PulF